MRRFIHTILKSASLTLMLFVSAMSFAQSGIYIPSAKPIKNMKAALESPETFCLVLKYSGYDTAYSINDLDWLDSAYNIAFDRDDTKLYSMRIEGYGGADQKLTESRVKGVYNYFANRCHAPFPIRYAVNPIQCSCHGDTIELIRYEVPTDMVVYDCKDLPDSRKVLNKNIDLTGCVMITFKNNPDDCIGMARGCYVPQKDSTIRGYYSSVFMKRGALYSVSNTKDECPSNVEFGIEEHLDYKDIVERYFLIPHRKQIIVQVGYIVLHSSINRSWGECSQDLTDSIFVRFPITQEQWENKVRIFGKKYSEKGMEYKALTTKKMPSKVSINIQAAINPMQLDTIFLGKKIQPDQMNDYFFEVKNDLEQGTFKVGGKFYMAYKMNKKGEYEIKKPLRALMRIIDDPVDEVEDKASDKKYKDDEEIE